MVNFYGEYKFKKKQDLWWKRKFNLQFLFPLLQDNTITINRFTITDYDKHLQISKPENAKNKYSYNIFQDKLNCLIHL